MCLIRESLYILPYIAIWYIAQFKAHSFLASSSSLEKDQLNRYTDKYKIQAKIMNIFHVLFMI